MMTDECDRWAELSDRVALEEALPPADRKFFEEHASSCRFCGAEQGVWEGLAACLADEAVRPVQAPETVEKRGTGTPPAPLRRKVFAGAAVVAVAATAALWLLPQRSPLPSDPSTRAPLASSNEEVPVRVVLVSGDAKMDGTQPSAGALLEDADRIVSGTGRVCLTHGKRATVCLDQGSEGRVLSSRDGVGRFELDKGRLAVHQPDGEAADSFQIKTRFGTISAVQARVVTAYTTEGELIVFSTRGKVSVEHKRGETKKLEGPGTLLLRRKGFGKAPGEEPQLVDALGRTDLWDEGTLTPVAVSSEPLGAEVTIDGTTWGQTPLSMMLTRGSHEVEIAHEGYRQEKRVIEVRGAERVLEEVALDRAEASAPKGTSQPSPSALVAQAQALRNQGKFAQAASVYQQLIRSYPASREAGTVRLSLAELQLSQLGAPAAALQWFRSYKSRGGPLGQEASYGEIRALRALGRDGEARSLAEIFVKQYPSSGQAVSLRRWLDSSKSGSP